MTGLTLRWLTLALFMALATFPAGAKDAAVTATIIIVDVQQAQRESAAGKMLMAQRDKYQQSFQTDFNSARQRLQTSDQDLARQKGSISQDLYDQKAKALEQEVVSFQRRTQVAVRALEKSTETATTELMNSILTVTGEIAGEMGANLILPKQQVVLHEPKMDVTAQVIERLNRRLPSINFPVPVVDEPLNPGSGGSSSGTKSGKK